MVTLNQGKFQKSVDEQLLLTQQYKYGQFKVVNGSIIIRFWFGSGY